MSKAWRYLAANGVVLICLWVYYDPEEKLWIFCTVGAGLLVAVNLLVAWIGKGDRRAV